ncbi:hypothetical protein IX39_10095 [Chryseobacterium formosense]|uniref:Uncharacterized protein n=2 Tax=Chryseobacterium formosense TaxID=236814 RepID=A0A085Z932_9FLAO|nr:hypothetical protein IX39_10095 [Chryseobacterium formosense]
MLIVSFFAFGQKVKLKDGSVSIDKVEVYKYEDDGVTTISTLSNKELFVIKPSYYEVPNPAYGSIGCPANNCPKMTRRAIFTVKFLNNGKELYTDISIKDLIKNIYKAGIFDSEGKTDEGKEDLFIDKYSNEDVKLRLLN